MVSLQLSLLRLRKLRWVLQQPQRLKLLRRRLAPSLEHEGLLCDRQFTTVIDVGANVGQFALFAAAKLGTTNLICIEPQSGALAHLPTFLEPFGCHAEVQEVALSDHTGVAPLHVTRASDSSSLLTPTHSMCLTDGGRSVTRRMDVEVVVGDDAIIRDDRPGPVLLKVDVQGTELSVLRGLRGTLGWIDAVLVEVSFDQLYENQSRPQDVIDLLRAQGFGLSAIAPVPGSSVEWKLGQADLLFDRAWGE